MPDIRLDDLTKIFPFIEVKGLFGRKKKQEVLEKQKAMPHTSNEGVIAVQHFSLDIRNGEFVVLLGPSGCGKTTVLRMIAGLERPTLGAVRFDGKDMNAVNPEDRDVAMVFQNYSLYPHLNVHDNIAFPLQSEHMPREELEERVLEMARLLDLESKLTRMPSELSGGENQRVAIARALVRRPGVFLMDEPFSNLDPSLRIRLREQVKEIHRRLGTTFVYVTHDQTEALSLGTRIVIMKDGLLRQDGTPSEVYRRPADAYVASFLGFPTLNLLEEVPVRGRGLLLFGQEFPLPSGIRRQLGSRKTCTVGFRPVHVVLTSEGIPAAVDWCEPTGAVTLVHLTADGRELIAAVPSDGAEQEPFRGQEVRFTLDPADLFVFGEDGQTLFDD